MDNLKHYLIMRKLFFTLSDPFKNLLLLAFLFILGDCAAGGPDIVEPDVRVKDQWLQVFANVLRLVEFLSKLELTHLLTLTVGVGSFTLLGPSKRFLPRIPAAVLVMIIVALLERGIDIDLEN